MGWFCQFESLVTDVIIVLSILNKRFAMVRVAWATTTILDKRKFVQIWLVDYFWNVDNMHIEWHRCVEENAWNTFCSLGTYLIFQHGVFLHTHLYHHEVLKGSTNLNTCLPNLNFRFYYAINIWNNIYAYQVLRLSNWSFDLNIENLWKRSLMDMLNKSVINGGSTTYDSFHILHLAFNSQWFHQCTIWKDKIFCPCALWLMITSCFSSDVLLASFFDNNHWKVGMKCKFINCQSHN
jgi:hypothetical protein